MKNSQDKKTRAKISGNIFSRVIYRFKSLPIVKHIFVFYLFITLLGSIILYLPISRINDVSYVDALFTSASAFSDTGLVSLTTAETWTYFGQSIIAMLIFVGGLGWFALKVYLFNILCGRPISFSTTNALASERGASKIGITRSLIKVSITIMIILIIIASIALSIYFYNVNVNDTSGPMAAMYNTQHSAEIASGTNPNVKEFKSLYEVPYHNWATSIRFGIFHAISALNNAGFDIMGQGSISAYYSHYGIQIIFILLFIAGGVGYPVIYDTYLWVKSKITGDVHRWTLFTKISMSMYTAIVVISLIVTFSIELTTKDRINNTNPNFSGPALDIPQNYQTLWHNDFYGTKGQKTMALIFNTLSTRNAGFATIDIDILSQPTIQFYSMLMFIGSAPSSTAGGIRTTTMAIVLLGIWTRIRGRKKTKIFNRSIPGDTVTRAYVVFTAAIITVLVATMVCSTSLVDHGGELNMPIYDSKGNIVNFIYSSNGNPYSYTEIFFEVSSAFGTTGLSAGVTSHLSIVSKITLILVMFIGQLGVSSSVLVWSGKNPGKKHYSYVKEEVLIG